ncbi:type I-F CRISPR-associated protein Csy2 [Aeromonas sp. RU39B]|uniref:type I-F CRISPR-associated protein Csy2 n=1 Tax=Aeromonas sp. RU39B TaxID=1907416 RepID=UPI000970ADFF|nr:type I-F CRISPR-associated protein Csy2 [Aeromonas sp. RU39B]
MKSTLLLRHLSVENANAISGLTYGFPAISHFLGFTHALSRRLEQAYGLTLGGCAVIAHHTELQSQPLGNRREQVFALTRNPLTKEGKTAPFNEEGRVHLDISLLIECNFDADRLPKGESLDLRIHELHAWFERIVPSLRLAGGTITRLGQVQWREHYEERERRRLCMSLLPGFALVCRHDLLTAHHQQQLSEEPDAELLDSLLDFVTLCHQSQQDEAGAVSWQPLDKPAPGYLVPLAVGYQGISPLHEPGSIPSSRDQTTPFRFVESIYTVGQWVSLHRVQNLDTLLWRYRYQEPYYLCENHYIAPSLSVEEDDEEFIS